MTKTPFPDLEDCPYTLTTSLPLLPLPQTFGNIGYFEAEIPSTNDNYSLFTIGLSPMNFSGFPGSARNTWNWSFEDNLISEHGVPSVRHQVPKPEPGDIVGCGYHWEYGCAFWTRNGRIVAWVPIPAELADRLCPSLGASRSRIRLNVGGLADETSRLQFDFALCDFDRLLDEFTVEFNQFVVQRLAELDEEFREALLEADEEDAAKMTKEDVIESVRVPRAINRAELDFTKSPSRSFSERLLLVSMEPFYTSAAQFVENPHLAGQFGIDCPCAWMDALPDSNGICPDCVLGCELDALRLAANALLIRKEAPQCIDSAVAFLRLELPSNSTIDDKAQALGRLIRQDISFRVERISLFLNSLGCSKSRYASRCCLRLNRRLPFSQCQNRTSRLSGYAGNGGGSRLAIRCIW